MLGYPTSVDALRARFAVLSRDPSQVVLVARDSTGGVIGWIH